MKWDSHVNKGVIEFDEARHGVNLAQIFSFEIYWDTNGYVKIDLDALELEIRVSLVLTNWFNIMLIQDDFLKLSTNLAAVLAGFDVDNLKVKTKTVFLLVRMIGNLKWAT